MEWQWEIGQTSSNPHTPIFYLNLMNLSHYRLLSHGEKFFLVAELPPPPPPHPHPPPPGRPILTEMFTLQRRPPYVTAIFTPGKTTASQSYVHRGPHLQVP